MFYLAIWEKFLNFAEIFAMGRDKFWDSLKFLLIIFVVYGHTIETFAPDGSYHRAMYNFIYSFHMPFFMFVSGRFSQIRDKRKYRRGIARLTETYLVFQLIRCLNVWHLGGNLELLECLFYPKGTLWYIAYLIIYRIIIYALPVKTLHSYLWTLLLGSFALSILWGFVPIVAGQKFFIYLPYFLMGLYSVKFDVKKFCWHIPFLMAILGLLAFFMSIYFFVNFNIGYVIYCSTPYYNSDPYLPSFVLLFARCVMYIYAFMIGLLLMRIVLVVDIFPKYGSKTLFIYMYHTFIVLTVRELIVRGYLDSDWASLLFCATAIVAGLTILSNIRFLIVCMNPISYVFIYFLNQINGHNKGFTKK